MTTLSGNTLQGNTLTGRGLLGHTPSETFTPLARPSRINFFGDSITAGTGATTENDRWVVKLAYYKALTMVNNGIAGTVLQNSTSLSGSPLAQNGRDRWVTDLNTGINRSSNYVIAYGLNDLRYNQSVTAPSQFSVDNFINDYREIIQGLIADGTDPVNICLVTPYWIPDAGYSTGTAGFTGSNRTVHETYVTRVLALATEMGCSSKDVYTLMKNSANPALLIGADNIHPNDAGHDFIFQAMSNIPTVAGKTAATDIVLASSSAVLTNLGANIWTSNDGLTQFNGIGQLVGTFTVGVEEAWIEAVYDNATDAGMILTFGTSPGLPATSGNSFLMLIAPNGIIFKAVNGGTSTSSGYTITTPGPSMKARMKAGVDGIVLLQTSTDSVTWTTRFSFTAGNPAVGTYYARIYTSGVRKTYKPKSFGIA